MTRTDTDTDSGRSVARRLRDHVGVVGLVYLGACAVLLVWALVVTAVDSSGESMAGVIPVLATAPSASCSSCCRAARSCSSPPSLSGQVSTRRSSAGAPAHCGAAVA